MRVPRIGLDAIGSAPRTCRGGDGGSIAFWWWVAFLFYCIALGGFMGCSSTPAKTVITPGKSDGVSKIHLFTAGGGRVEVEERVGGTGAGATATGDKLNDQITGSPPSVSMGGMDATGGGVSGKFQGSAFFAPATTWANPMFWIGLACIGGAGAAVYFGIKRAAIVSAVAGVGLLAAAFYPIILPIVVVVLAMPYLWVEYQNWKTREAFRAREAGLATANLDPSARAAIEKATANHATGTDLPTIAALKAVDGLS